MGWVGFTGYSNYSTSVHFHFPFLRNVCTQGKAVTDISLTDRLQL